MMRKAAALLFLSGILWGATPPVVPIILTNPITDPTGATTYNGQTPIVAPVALYVIPIVTTGTYQMLNTDTLILASATISVPFTITLPSAVNLGHTVNIVKIDASTQTVVLNTSGTDLIAGTTGTVYLYATSAVIHLVSDGIKNWWPLDKLPSAPPFIGYNFDQSVSAADGNANQANFVAFYVPDPCSVYGMTWEQDTGAGGNVDVGIYNTNSSNNAPGTLLAHSGSVANPGASQVNTVNFTSAVNILPGVYWLAMAWSSTTPKVFKFSTNTFVSQAVQASAFPLPATAASTPASGKSWALVGRVYNGL